MKTKIHANDVDKALEVIHKTQNDAMNRRGRDPQE